MNTCKNCKHSAESDVNIGTMKRELKCCYNPPKAFPIMSQQGFGHVTLFPTVQEEWHCGKFEHKESN